MLHRWFLKEMSLKWVLSAKGTAHLRFLQSKVFQWARHKNVKLTVKHMTVLFVHAYSRRRKSGEFFLQTFSDQYQLQYFTYPTKMKGVITVSCYRN